MPPFLTGAVTYSPRLTPKEQQLVGLRDRLQRLDVLMEQGIAPDAVAPLERHWETKGAAFGHPWAPWAASTFRARVRKGNVAKGILRDRDDLFRSLFDAIRSGRRLARVGAGVRLSLAPDDPTERRKFLWHLRGTRRMPARPPVPLPLPRSFRDRVRFLARDFVLTGRLRGAGGQFVAAGAGGAA